MNKLTNKVAIITGGAKGQGAAEAELFIKAGAKVVITDVDKTEGMAVAGRLGPDCEFVQHDVTSETAWKQLAERTVDRHGHIDVLVNNAGTFHMLGLEETTLDTWNQLVATNQTGVFLGMQSIVPFMKRNGSGSIVNISSIAGLTSSRAHAYAATKWAVRGMSKSAAVELGPYGIRVNSVHPGYIETRMLDEFEFTRQELADRVPLGRVGDVFDVARLVLFLASDDSSYCSGHEFTIDGALRS